MTTDARETYPVYLHHHPEHEATIALIGMEHWARSGEGYERVRHYVLEREAAGSVIHIEHLQPASDAQLRRVSPAVRRKYELLEEGLTCLDDAHAMLRRATQHASLPTSETWQVHDMTLLELSRRLSDGFVQDLWESATEMWQAISDSDDAAKDALREWVDAGIGNDIGVASDQGTEVLGPDIVSELDDVTVRQRNLIALAAIRRVITQKPTQDITLIWGNAHLPGLSAGCVKMGYVLGTQFEI